MIATDNRIHKSPDIFVGRQYELAALGRHFQLPRPRLIGITGPEGIGKTRLVLQALSCFTDLFDSPVCFLSLNTSTYDQAVFAASRAAGLLVLDGWSGRRAWENMLLEMLLSLPAARVLITARRLPPLPDLVKVRLDALPVPPAGQRTGLEHNPAVALYLAAVKHARPAFIPTSTDLAAAARICRDTCGVPGLILQEAAFAQKRA